MERIPGMENKPTGAPVRMRRRLTGSAFLILGTAVLAGNLMIQSQDVGAAITGSGPHRPLILEAVSATVLTAAITLLAILGALRNGRAPLLSAGAGIAALGTFLIMAWLSVVHPQWESPGAISLLFFAIGASLLDLRRDPLRPVRRSSV